MIEDFAVVVRRKARPARTPAEAVAFLEVVDELRRSAGPPVCKPSLSTR